MTDRPDTPETEDQTQTEPITMPELPPADKKKILKSFWPVMLLEIAASAIMVGVYVALGRFSGKVLFGALLGTATELYSPSEYDTITVPAVIAAVLLMTAL